MAALRPSGANVAKRLSLESLQQNVLTVASFEVCASAFKDGPKRTDWAPEDCFV